ncbi:MAG: DUF4433 domain-containing protein [Planctomycetia bacterium]|nr:DUF4433 domain-containing protein [Planctomycetia bacterium]
MAKADIKSLYYITHVDNVPSMLERGILSHATIEQRKIAFTPVYDAEIVSNRREKRPFGQRSLWDYSNLYFQPRNPMLYRVICEGNKSNLAVVGVRPAALDLEGVVVSDGNAASAPTRFFPAAEGLSRIREEWQIIQREWWRADDGSKRRIMAECLVPERVPAELIHTIFVAGHTEREALLKKLPGAKVQIVPEPHIFFQPLRSWRVGTKISLVDGDMFFSGMQTLTVSVNLKGVMGKGLASRAKYQFPDVYVFYQDACRSKKLTAARPALYKRESPLEEELAESGEMLKTKNGAKWFLLFATKRHWKDRSRPEDIEAGMAWIEKNYAAEGIQSLALPALGCGLGGLEWKTVGPLMCRYLNRLSIPSAIYLPREREIEPAYLSADYLLSP